MCGVHGFSDGGSNGGSTMGDPPHNGGSTTGDPPHDGGSKMGDPTYDTTKLFLEVLPRVTEYS